MIAVDAMGGDYAPDAIVAGTLEASRMIQADIYLVGVESQIRARLPSQLPVNLHIQHASEVVEMHESPTDALRRKKDSSLAVACRLVKEGQAKVMVSAGNTGAASAASLLSWRQVPGVHRPAIASTFPNKHDGFLLLDAGASPDVDPEHLVEFALMGRAYAEKVMGRRNPRVHLLNIGEEEGKGNAFAKAAYKLLSAHPWFAGNIEGKDCFHQPCDVIVCDAFVGNIVLKTCEGAGEFFIDLVKAQIPSNPLLRLLFLPMKKVMSPLRKTLDYAEYGGSPLLGLNGTTIICHGRSNAKAIRNAVLLAHKAAENDLVETIRNSFCQLEPITP